MKKIVFIVILIILIFITPNRFEPFDANLNFVISIIYLVNLLYFLFLYSMKNKNWFSFEIFFLIGYTIVHFQIPFLASLGKEPLDPSFIWINKQVVNFATWLSAVAINLWMLGYILVNGKKKLHLKHSFQKLAKPNFLKYDVILVIFYISFLFFVGSTFFTGEVQGSGTWGSTAVYINLIFSNLLCLRIIYFFMMIPKNSSVIKIIKEISSNKIFVTVLFTSSILFLVSGDRGPVMNTALIAGGAYALFVKPIKLNQLMLLILIGSFTFTLIGLGRGERVDGFGEKNILERGYSEYLAKKENINITNELAASVRIQYRALDAIPDLHPHLYGSTYLFGLTNLIPFSGSMIISIIDVPVIYTDSSIFFTFLGQGNWSTWGEGSEILADMYINFGTIGVFIIMFLFGVFSKKIAGKISVRNIHFVIIYMAFLMSAIYINRSHLLYPLKNIVYMLFFNYIFTRVIK